MIERFKHFIDGEPRADSMRFEETAEVIPTNIFRAYGIQVVNQPIQGRFNIDSEHFPAGLTDSDTIGFISFIPLNPEIAGSTESKRSQNNLVSGMLGLQEYFTYLDEKHEQSSPLPKPSYLLNVTHAEMARIASKFGFDVFEEDEHYFVAGKTEEIQDKFRQYMDSHMDTDGNNTLIKRVKAQSPELWGPLLDKPPIHVENGAIFDIPVEGIIGQISELERRSKLRIANSAALGCAAATSVNVGIDMYQQDPGGLAFSGTLGVCGAGTYYFARKRINSTEESE